MSKKTILIIASLCLLAVAAGSLYYFFLYRPNWEVQKIVREGELAGQTVQTVTAERSYRDFTFSPTMNGLTAHIADLPANANILSLHIQMEDVFFGEHDAVPNMQILIQNDDGTACTIDINTFTDEIQQLTSGKICAMDMQSTVFLRDASAMPALISGSMKVLLSYIVF
ncbi:hypothetical protein HY839_00945 [Candidatus Azambacteria bacterium]|nr:hypothetical protein [Candidatus Azambacteria bacterium]